MGYCLADIQPKSRAQFLLHQLHPLFLQHIKPGRRKKNVLIAGNSKGVLPCAVVIKCNNVACVHGISTTLRKDTVEARRLQARLGLLDARLPLVEAGLQAYREKHPNKFDNILFHPHLHGVGIGDETRLWDTLVRACTNLKQMLRLNGIVVICAFNPKAHLCASYRDTIQQSLQHGLTSPSTRIIASEIRELTFVNATDVDLQQQYLWRSFVHIVAQRIL